MLDHDFRHFSNEARAADYARRYNTSWGPVLVVVEGPGDAQWSTMPLKDAIEGDFAYTWYGVRRAVQL